MVFTDLELVVREQDAAASEFSVAPDSNLGVFAHWFAAADLEHNFFAGADALEDEQDTVVLEGAADHLLPAEVPQLTSTLDYLIPPQVFTGAVSFFYGNEFGDDLPQEKPTSLRSTQDALQDGAFRSELDF
jgi:hypothetical protein